MTGGLEGAKSSSVRLRNVELKHTWNQHHHDRQDSPALSDRHSRHDMFIWAREQTTSRNRKEVRARRSTQSLIRPGSHVGAPWRSPRTPWGSPQGRKSLGQGRSRFSECGGLWYFVLTVSGVDSWCMPRDGTDIVSTIDRKIVFLCVANPANYRWEASKVPGSRVSLLRLKQQAVT